MTTVEDEQLLISGSALDCPSCHGHFAVVPFILPCGHSVCEPCSLTIDRQYKSGGAVCKCKCPVCFLWLISDHVIPRNFAIQAVLQSTKHTVESTTDNSGSLIRPTGNGRLKMECAKLENERLGTRLAQLKREKPRASLWLRCMALSGVVCALIFMSMAMADLHYSEMAMFKEMFETEEDNAKDKLMDALYSRGLFECTIDEFLELSPGYDRTIEYIGSIECGSLPASINQQPLPPSRQIETELVEQVEMLEEEDEEEDEGFEWSWESVVECITGVFKLMGSHLRAHICTTLNWLHSSCNYAGFLFWKYLFHTIIGVSAPRIWISIFKR